MYQVFFSFIAQFKTFVRKVIKCNKLFDDVFKGDLLCFSIFSVKYIMLQCLMFIFNVAKVSNNKVNICRGNICEQILQASVCTKRSNSFQQFFYSCDSVMSQCARFPYMVICFRHATASDDIMQPMLLHEDTC